MTMEELAEEYKQRAVEIQLAIERLKAQGVTKQSANRLHLMKTMLNDVREVRRCILDYCRGRDP